MVETSTAYPMRLSIDYREKLNRLTTFFRLLTAIPIAIILLFLVAGTSSQGDGANGGTYSAVGFGGLVFVPIVLMLLFRKKYPRWWFDWNLALTRFCTRVFAYIDLLTDVYPSTDEDQAVHIEIAYPDAQKELMSGMPLVKWLLAIPHYIILVFLWIAATVCVVIAWFAILFTSRYPRGLFDFVVGVYRWSLRVEVYAFLLTTDRYPPFSLSE